MSKLTRAIRKTVRLNDEEWNKLEGLMDKANSGKGQTVSEWVRDRIRLARVK